MACLFYRILHHRIVDHHRLRQKQAGLFGWLRHAGTKRYSGDNTDPVDNIADNHHLQPEHVITHRELGHHIEQALGSLPLRQRQAFLLRCWQGLSVTETAHAMACSQGSVKTHLSRALSSLRSGLQEYKNTFDNTDP